MEDPVPTVPFGGLTERGPLYTESLACVALGVLAMPCSSVKPRVKPKFVEVTPSDIETYEVDVFKRY
eukprot:9292961-Heterocapsa_arctica.AAC.1